ncbi:MULTISPECIES: oxaloacetate decarboxylase subunit gamma [Vibrio]|uniref:oxaloacetate decarboxylase subunit gamma n=1 Tax=Vibrio TaxID=662 RepID=UPI0005A8D7E9|nr:oxaloacetate decarboxylase subunit gamma [Vibrio diazotrophicus]
MTNIGSLLVDAATLMMTGMGFVFLFLTILVYLVRLMSKLVPQEVPQPISTPIKNKKVPVKSGALNQQTVSPQVVAAISAAVHQHRTLAAAKGSK